MGEAHRPFRLMSQSMLTLYSCPPLFGVTDNADFAAIASLMPAHGYIVRHCRDIHEAVSR
jgi:hypothetical protein